MNRSFGRRAWFAAAASASASASLAAQSSLTADQLVQRIQKAVAIPWRAQTVDKLIVGKPDQVVKGIATTMMSTFEVLKRAHAQGCNLVVTHEPTYYNGQDSVDQLSQHANYRAKSEWIAQNQMAIFRFHDHWHAMKPDGIAFGMAKELGWLSLTHNAQLRKFHHPAKIVSGVMSEVESKLSAPSMRLVGNQNMPLNKIAVAWGYASLNQIEMLNDPEVSLLIVGECREWELVEYVQDQIAAGQRKALLIVGHVPSEQAGMKYCAEWMRTFISEVPVKFIASADPFA
jgi:putative NIF3 family GTP cyclohydrolase 1 type 2